MADASILDGARDRAFAAPIHGRWQASSVTKVFQLAGAVQELPYVQHAPLCGAFAHTTTAAQPVSGGVAAGGGHCSRGASRSAQMPWLQYGSKAAHMGAGEAHPFREGHVASDSARAVDSRSAWRARATGTPHMP